MKYKAALFDLDGTLLDTDENNWSADPKDDQINVPANAENHWKFRLKSGIF